MNATASIESITCHHVCRHTEVHSMAHVFNLLRFRSISVLRLCPRIVREDSKRRYSTKVHLEMPRQARSDSRHRALPGLYEGSMNGFGITRFIRLFLSSIGVDAAGKGGNCCISVDAGETRRLVLVGQVIQRLQQSGNEMTYPTS